MASAGTVSIDFAAETARFTAELKKVQGSLNRLESDFRSLNKIADLAIRAFSVVALTNFAKQAFAAADATATAAERAGIAVESFSRLQFAAGQLDVDVNALTGGIQRFQVALANADSGNREAQRSLALFNLQAKDLAGLQIEAQLGEVAEAFKRITDPAERTRAAVELFGRSAGPQLVPFLAQGKSGIADFTAEADRLGITLRASTALGIDQADQALKRLIATAKGATADVLGRISLAISPPKDEAGKLAVQIDALTRERQAILNARAAGDQDAGTGFLGQQTLEEIDAKLAQLQSRLRAIREEALGDQRMQLLPLPWIGLQEIDLAPIQAMKIPVDELAEAYRQLDISARAARQAQLDTIASGAIEHEAEIQAQITADLQSQLEARATISQYYRDLEIRRQEGAEAAIQALKRATFNNGLAALQAFSSHSKKIAIAAILLQKGQALKEAFLAGQVTIAKAAASAPPPGNFGAIAWATAFVAANLAAIAATGIGQIQSIQRGGASLGSVANPVFTNSQDEAVEQVGAKQRGATNIIIQGDVFSSQETVDYLIERIREAVDERDAVIIGGNSRNAQDLVGS